MFAVHGLVNEIVSDNGSQFISEEFKNYLNTTGIKYTRVTIHWPTANGLVEGFNKSLKKVIISVTMVEKPGELKCIGFFYNIDPLHKLRQDPRLHSYYLIEC